jgi:hypothetical protein
MFLFCDDLICELQNINVSSVNKITVVFSLGYHFSTRRTLKTQTPEWKMD